MKNTNTYTTGMTKPYNWSDNDLKFFLAGFIEGEGSTNVSIKVQNSVKYKVRLQPEFNAVQHESG
jgi:hypothetical protein